MTSAELSEWLAFENEYGLPDEYFTSALVCRTVAGAMGGKNLSAEDFVPYFRRPRRPQTASEQQSIMRAHFASAKARAGRV